MRRKVSTPTALMVLLLAACGLDVVGIDPTLVGDVGDGGGAIDGRVLEPLDSGARDVVTDSPAKPSDAGVDATPEPPDANPCAACAAGSARKQCLNNACVESRRVFVTSGKWNGNLGGVSGGDAKCQAAAQAAGLGGTWFAWLSETGSAPQMRFEKATVPYRRLDGTAIANNWNELADGALNASLQVDETGALINASMGVEVWTGTKENGDRLDPTCQGFTAMQGNQEALVGVADQNGQNWTHIYTKTCNNGLRLYCFEQ